MSDHKDTIPFGYCHCGCGQKTNICDRNNKATGRKRGEPYLFVLNHHHIASAKPDFIVNEETGCWEWQKEVTRSGYGRTRVKGTNKKVMAHRFYYERKFGKIDDELEPDHLCRNPRCCNPDHLEPVTRVENTRRGNATKLTREQVIHLRSLKGTTTHKEIAKKFGISRSHASQILNGNRGLWSKEMTAKEGTDGR